MPVLECDSIDDIVDSVKNLVPFPLMSLHGNSVRASLEIGPHNGLLPVNPWGDECRKPAGNLLALASHFVEGIYRAFGLAADFGADVPAPEAVVLLAIHLPHLVNDIFVSLYLS